MRKAHSHFSVSRLSIMKLVKDLVAAFFLFSTVNDAALYYGFDLKSVNCFSMNITVASNYSCFIKRNGDSCNASFIVEVFKATKVMDVTV